MLFTATPIIQFTHLDHFLADLNAGHVIGVWHDLLARPGFGYRHHTLVRALVVQTDPIAIAHIAALAFGHDTRVIAANGRQADDEAHRQTHAADHARLIDHITEELTTIGILPNRVRPGVLDIPYPYTLIYARPPAGITQ